MSSQDKASPGAGEPVLGGGPPRETPERVWGGSGSGLDCAICGERIGSDQLEYELEFRDANRGWTSYHVHVGCCLEWKLGRNPFD